jgi:stage IV sporulation protein FB
LIRFRIFGCIVELSFLFVAATACTVLLDRTGCILSTLFASVLHECGHLTAMFCFGGAPEKITFGVFNIDIVDQNRTRRGYRQDFIILLAGPAVNLILFVLLYAMSCLIPGVNVVFAASTHLLIGLFNLLPVESLDGGQILYALLCERITPERASRWVLAVSFFSLLPVAAMGFIVLLQSKYNFSLLLASCYLIGQLLLRRGRYE